MKKGRARTVSWMGTAAAALLLTLAFAKVSPGLAAAPASRPAADPLAAEIERWSAFLRSDAASRGVWPQLKRGDQPLLAHAAQDLAQGRRLLALHRFAMARVDLGIGDYLSARTADQHREMPRFEAEWARMGKVLSGGLGQ